MEELQSREEEQYCQQWHSNPSAHSVCPVGNSNAAEVRYESHRFALLFFLCGFYFRVPEILTSIFIQSTTYNHLVSSSLTHSASTNFLTHSLTHSLNHSFSHSFNYSFIDLFIFSHTHSFILSFTHFHSLHLLVNISFCMP